MDKYTIHFQSDRKRDHQARMSPGNRPARRLAAGQLHYRGLNINVRTLLC